MPAWLRMTGHFIRVFWWVIVLVLVAALVGVIYLVNRKKRQVIAEAAGQNAPSLVAEATRHVREAVTDVKVERAIIGSDTTAKRKELEEIRSEPDGEKRRDRLAALLQKNL